MRILADAFEILELKIWNISFSLIMPKYSKKINVLSHFCHAKADGGSCYAPIK